MCLQFTIDNYLLQALGWALTECGDLAPKPTVKPLSAGLGP